MDSIKSFIRLGNWVSILLTMCLPCGVVYLFMQLYWVCLVVIKSEAKIFSVFDKMLHDFKIFNAYALILFYSICFFQFQFPSLYLLIN